MHGGNNEADSDGYPEAWFTQNYSETGSAWIKKTYTYSNDQEAATLWYHDHTFGLTHLNIYAGLAGVYLLRDDNENNLIESNILPSGPYEQELLLQDRTFTADGQLYIPTDTETANAPENSLTPEFFGNFMMVNGMAWPKLDVEPRKYRFELVNGTDSRTYILKFDNPAEKFYEIGTAQGFLDQPIALDQIVLAPGQRMDVVVDFSNNPIGDQLILKNFGPDSPFGGLSADDLEPANPATTGQVMKFVVDKPLSTIPNAEIDLQGLTTPLRSTPLTTPIQTGPTANVVLFESEDQFGRIQPRLGTLADGSLLWEDPATENIPLGTSVVWEIYNTTEDSHSVHLHSSAFRILTRQSFEGDVIDAGIDSAGGTKQYLQNVRLTGTPADPDLSEQGWEDTFNINPGEVVRLITRPYDQPGTFVWHCHVLSHEDNAMMRPFNVVASSEATSSSYPANGMMSGTIASNWLNTNQLPNSDGHMLAATSEFLMGNRGITTCF